MASSQFGGLPVFTAAAIAAAALAAGLTLPALVPAAAVVPRRLGIKARSQQGRGVLDEHELARRSLTWLIQAFGTGGRHAADTAVGVMVASPSRPEDRPGGKDENECYYFNWPRDTGLCVRALIGALERAEQGLEIGVEQESARRLHGIIKDTVELNMKLQLLPNRSGTFETGGIGEPKYMPDGSAFEDSWGRPQNDGPALRALSYLRYANYLLATRPAGSSELEFISTLHPRGGTPDSVRALVRDDLDFVARVWATDNTFELWEEVEASPSAGGGHFHVLCVQRAALLSGARFAARGDIADEERAERYTAAAHAIEERMERFWITDGKIEHEGGEAIKEGPMAIEWDDARRLGAISKSTLALPHATPTLQRLGGQQKPTEVDVACVLGFIHGWSGHLEGQDKDLWAPWGERAAATLYRCLLVFRDVYAINQGKELKDGILVGRYPEDVYDGVVQSIGHPWFLTTHGTAELLFISAAHWARLGHVKITALSLPLLQICDPSANIGTFHRGSDEYERALRGLRSLAEQQLARCRELVYSDGRMDEQIERQSAVQRGARHLSWSYASYLSCWDARDAREART